jgi:ribose transport system permease protein
MVVFFSLASPYFMTWTNMVNLGQTLATSGIVAFAMTLVIISGGIDLSVGSVAALAGVLTSLLWTFLGVPLALAAILGVLSGVMVGIVNGFMITRIKISPLITTLATFSIVRGLAFVISNGQTNQLNNDAFKFLGRGDIAGVPFSLILMVIVYVFFSYLLSHTRFGRNVFAIGGNAEASRLAGIPINRTLMWVYILSGLFAAFAGIIIAAQLALSAPRAAVGLELTAIAAVVLGGTSLSGGKGTLFGTLLGVLILRVLDNGLVLLNVSSFYQDVASGVVLLLAVGFDQVRQRLGDRT